MRYEDLQSFKDAAKEAIREYIRSKKRQTPNVAFAHDLLGILDASENRLHLTTVLYAAYANLYHQSRSRGGLIKKIAGVLAIELEADPKAVDAFLATRSKRISQVREAAKVFSIVGLLVGGVVPGLVALAIMHVMDKEKEHAHAPAPIGGHPEEFGNYLEAFLEKRDQEKELKAKGYIYVPSPASERDTWSVAADADPLRTQFDAYAIRELKPISSMDAQDSKVTKAQPVKQFDLGKDPQAMAIAEVSGDRVKWVREISGPGSQLTTVLRVDASGPRFMARGARGEGLKLANPTPKLKQKTTVARPATGMGVPLLSASNGSTINYSSTSSGDDYFAKPAVSLVAAAPVLIYANPSRLTRAQAQEVGGTWVPPRATK